MSLQAQRSLGQAQFERALTQYPNDCKRSAQRLKFVIQKTLEYTRKQNAEPQALSSIKTLFDKWRIPIGKIGEVFTALQSLKRGGVNQGFNGIGKGDIPF